MAASGNATDQQRTSSHMDSGWAWVIAAAGAVATFAVTAVLRAQSLLIVEILEAYETTTAEVSYIVTWWGIGSSLCALLFMFGIGDIFHERALILIAGLLNSVGLIVIYFSTRVAQTYLLGFFSGFTIQIGFVCTMTLTGKYFRKRLALGTGLAVSGASFGILLTPALFELLKDKYTYRGSALILAAISLNMFVSAALMRPPRGPTRKREISTEVFRIRVEPPAFSQNEYRSGRAIPRGRDSSHISWPDSDRGIALCVSGTTSGHYQDDMISANTKIDSTVETTLEVADISNLSSRTARVTISGGEGRRKQGEDLACQRIVSSIKDFVIKPTWRKTEQNSALKTFMFTFGFFKNPRFILFQTSNYISAIGMFFLIQFYPAISRDIGMNGYQTALLLFFTGLADLFGRIFFGFLGDCNILQRYKLYAIPQYIVCCGCFLSTFSAEFWAQTIFAVVVGINNGVLFSFRSATLVELFDLPTLSRRLGVSSLMSGLGSTTAGPLFGYVRDAAGSYDLPLYVAGAMFFVSASTLLAIRLTTVRCCYRRDQ